MYTVLGHIWGFIGNRVELLVFGAGRPSGQNSSSPLGGIILHRDFCKERSRTGALQEKGWHI